MMDKLNGYKTYIALALSLLFQALSATHKVNIDPNAAADATNVLYQIAGAVMAGIGIWGRLKATTPGALADPAKAVTDAKATILAAPVSAGGKDGGAAGAGTVTKLIAIALLVGASVAMGQTIVDTDRHKTGPLDEANVTYLVAGIDNVTTTESLAAKAIKREDAILILSPPVFPPAISLEKRVIVLESEVASLYAAVIDLTEALKHCKCK